VGGKGVGGAGCGGVPRLLICSLLAAALSMLSTGSAAITKPQARPQPAALTTMASPDQLPEQRFGWPLAGSPAVVRGFHLPAFRYGPGHRGVDLAAVAGGPVLAAGAGTVVFAGMVAGRGVVSVSHDGGLRTTYEPVAASVSTGQRVTKGQQIGTVQPGHPGCTVAVCLHWGAFRGRAQAPNPGDVERNYVDPRWLITGARVRLLPIDRHWIPHDVRHPDLPEADTWHPALFNRPKPPASCSGAVALLSCAADRPLIR
jgi:Peptidase family M23